MLSRPGITIFIVFFGLTVLDAIRNGPWERVVFWGILAVAFVALDLMRGRRRAGRGPG